MYYTFARMETKYSPHSSAVLCQRQFHLFLINDKVFGTHNPVRAERSENTFAGNVVRPLLPRYLFDKKKAGFDPTTQRQIMKYKFYVNRLRRTMACGKGWTLALSVSMHETSQKTHKTSGRLRSHTSSRGRALLLYARSTQG